MEDLDQDLSEMDRERLVAEVKRLRKAVRTHRDSSGHDLCWYHPELWAVLPEKVHPKPTVPDWPQFMKGCVKYRQSLDQDAPEAPRSKEEAP